MIRQNTKLSIHVRLWHRGKLILNTARQTRARILASIQGKIFDNAYLRVSQAGELLNDGDYYDLATLKQAIIAFTETSLIEFICSDQTE